jgi:CTP synthase (UTP-ammonia lyase)
MNAAIALVGDHNPRVTAHAAIPRALELARAATDAEVSWTWVPTAAIGDARRDLAAFAAIWAVPASPYASMDGALAAIQFARETGRPFLGTCGGCQHALIEIARHVCGTAGADHAETNPGGSELVITPLACALVEKAGAITFTPGSRLHAIFAGEPAQEEYHCRYGLNPEWRARLEAAGVRFTGFDPAGEVRAAELPAHPFFFATLFQPERSGLRGKLHPLIAAFVRAASAVGPRP